MTSRDRRDVERIQSADMMSARFDPDTKEFKRFKIKTHPAQMRRLGIDANNIIWYGVYGSPGKKGKVAGLIPRPAP